MSLLSVAPDIVSEASGNLENLGTALRSANASAASQTTAVVAPAADEVSAAITAALGTHAQEFQTLNAQAAAFHDEFVSRLSGGAAQYVSTELANAQQALADTVNAPARALLGGPLMESGPGSVAAAGGFPGISENFNFGPFGISLSTTAVSFGTGGFLGASNASVSLNTPFGLVPLLSASGTSAIAPDGQFLLSLGQTVPYFSYGASMSGTLVPAIQITGLTLDVDGLVVSSPGTYLGGILPNVSFS
jgi:PE family